MQLIISEKPSVAQTIAAALGVKGKQDGYIEIKKLFKTKNFIFHSCDNHHVYPLRLTSKI